MSEFVKRSITGAVYVAVTLGAAMLGQWVTLLVFLPVCLLAAREWQALRVVEGTVAVPLWSTLVLCGTAYAGMGLLPMMPWLRVGHLALVLLAVLFLLIHMILRTGDKDPMSAFTFHLGTVLYIAAPFALSTHFLATGPHPFLGFMFLLWTSDTGAYLVGRAIGRNKLMPAVSPGKTWEGLVGGVMLTMALGWVLSLYWKEFTAVQWMAGAAAVAMSATLGDLLESAFKRAHGVKDSGNVLPGHGGILDRFDGFLLAAPAMWLMIQALS